MEELRRDGSSLEDKFISVLGADGQETQKLSWLE
jgi:hypothetical protein